MRNNARASAANPVVNHDFSASDVFFLGMTAFIEIRSYSFAPA
jgi:hypothetical protein